MGALARLKEGAEECDCGRVCFGPLMAIADAHELIATVETQEAELAALKAHTTDVTEELHRQLDTARREAAALRDRADSLAEDNADLEATDSTWLREKLMRVAEATKAACVAVCFALPDTAPIGDADYAVSGVDLAAIVDAEVKS